MKHSKYLLWILILILLVSSTLAASECNIRFLDNSKMNPGFNDGVMLFQIYEEIFEGQDNSSNYSILHATCSLTIYEYTPNNPPYNLTILTTEPYDNIDHGIRFSNTLGVVSFMLDMDKPYWVLGSNYTWQLYCYCLNKENIGTQSQHYCWYDNGTQTPFLTWSDYGNFTIGTQDYRDLQRSTLVTILGLIAIILAFSFMGYATGKSTIGLMSLSTRIFFYGVAFIELLILGFILYMHKASETIIPMMRINFWILLILGFGIGMVVLFIFMLRLMDVGDKDNDKKWGK